MNSARGMMQGALQTRTPTQLKGLGFRVQGLGFRVQDLGFRVQGFGLRNENRGRDRSGNIKRSRNRNSSILGL